MEYDVIVIGAGPAGLSAALYLGRANLKTLVLEAAGAGGQVNYTHKIDNYPGFSGTGADLAEMMRTQSLEFGAHMSAEKAIEFKTGLMGLKTVKTRRNEYCAKYVIIAGGAVARRLGVPGEDELRGAGVSYCAICDGAFFAGKTAVVAGGGNTAFEDAEYLSGVCNKVYLINRSEKFRANATLVQRVRSNPKITVHTNEIIEKIQGNSKVTSVVLKHSLSSRIRVLDTDAVFVAVGRKPETELYENLVNLDENGYIITDANMRTNLPGVYAVGDIRNTPLRQIITAAADGAVAANDIVNNFSR